MTGEHSELGIELQADPESNDEEIAELSSRLRGELLQLDVDTVDHATVGQAPADAKAIDVLAFGSLIVRFALRPDVLRSVVSGVQSWVGRQQMCSVKLTLDGDTLEITGRQSAQQERLVDLWISRHACSR